MPRKTISNEQWREIIQTCRNSGLSDYEWCKSNGVAVSTFYKYAKKFRERASISLPSFGVRTKPETQEVVPVEMPSQMTTFIDHNAPLTMENPAISIHIDGIRMDISNHADATLLHNTLQVLKSIC